MQAERSEKPKFREIFVYGLIFAGCWVGFGILRDKSPVDEQFMLIGMIICAAMSVISFVYIAFVAVAWLWRDRRWLAQRVKELEKQLHDMEGVAGSRLEQIQSLNAQLLSAGDRIIELLDPGDKGGDWWPSDGDRAARLRVFLTQLEERAALTEKHFKNVATEMTRLARPLGIHVDLEPEIGRDWASCKHLDDTMYNTTTAAVVRINEVLEQQAAAERAAEEQSLALEQAHEYTQTLVQFIAETLTAATDVVQTCHKRVRFYVEGESEGDRATREVQLNGRMRTLRFTMANLVVRGLRDHIDGNIRDTFGHRLILPAFHATVMRPGPPFDDDAHEHAWFRLVRRKVMEINQHPALLEEGPPEATEA